MANGVLLILLDVEQFMPISEYFDGAQKFIEHVKSSPPAAGVDEILLPGEIEQKVKRQRDAEGIYVEEETCRQVLQWGSKLGVELELKLFIDFACMLAIWGGIRWSHGALGCPSTDL